MRELQDEAYREGTWLGRIFLHVDNYIGCRKLYCPWRDLHRQGKLPRNSRVEFRTPQTGPVPEMDRSAESTLSAVCFEESEPHVRKGSRRPA